MCNFLSCFWIEQIAVDRLVYRAISKMHHRVKPTQRCYWFPRASPGQTSEAAYISASSKKLPTVLTTTCAVMGWPLFNWCGTIRVLMHIAKVLCIRLSGSATNQVICLLWYVFVTQSTLLIIEIYSKGLNFNQSHFHIPGWFGSWLYAMVSAHLWYGSWIATTLKCFDSRNMYWWSIYDKVLLN